MRLVSVVVAGAMLGVGAVAPAAAQDVGIKGGLNFSRFAVDPEPEDVTFPYTYGPTGGVFLAAGDGAVGVQIEALFSRKGSKIDDGDERLLTLDYVDIPLLLRFNGVPANGTTVFVTFGPTIGVNIRAREEQSDGSDADIKDEVEQIEYGLSVGLGVQVQSVTLEGRYTHGFSDVAKMMDDVEIRHRTYSVLLGFVF